MEFYHTLVSGQCDEEGIMLQGNNNNKLLCILPGECSANTFPICQRQMLHSPHHPTPANSTLLRRLLVAAQRKALLLTHSPCPKSPSWITRTLCPQALLVRPSAELKEGVVGIRTKPWKTR